MKTGGRLAVAKWRFGKDALLQRVWTCEKDDPGDEVVEFVSGEEADDELERFISRQSFEGTVPVSDGRGVYGYEYETEGVTHRIEFWDCEEITYSEYEKGER